MPRITFDTRGDFKNTDRFLTRMSKADFDAAIEQYARQGVSALVAATPIDSGETANSWDYTVQKSKNSFSIIWTNSHIDDGVPIAIILQYGHGTGTGGYVQGRDYINPAIRPIFDSIAENVWKVVTSA